MPAKRTTSAQNQKITPRSKPTTSHHLTSNHPSSPQYRPRRTHHLITHHNLIPSATPCLQPSPRANLHATGQLNTNAKVGERTQAGIVIDCGMGIDDSALTNHRINTHHRQRHDRRTCANNSGGTHASAMMHHRYQWQPNGVNSLEPLFTHDI